MRGTGAYGIGGYSRGVAEAGIDRERDQLTLQKARDIADLRSRIVEICDPIPAPAATDAPVPLQSNDALDRASGIVNTLQELNDLYERGILTNEEFQAAKRRALGLE